METEAEHPVSRSIHDEELLHDDEHYDEPDAADAAGAFSRKTKTMIIVALVVVAGLAAGLTFFAVDEGAPVSIELTGPSRSDDLLTFAYTIRTERAAATGPTKLTVSYENSTVYTREFPAGGGGGRVDVRFRDIIWGNGEYQFKLEYKDKSTVARYTVGIPDQTNFIVTAVGAPTEPPGAEPMAITYVEDGHRAAIYYTVYFFSDINAGFQTRAPPDTFLRMQVSKNGFPDGAPLNVSVAGLTFYTHIFNVSLGPGNYTIDATFTNQWVRADSPIAQFQLSNRTFVQNKPYACVGGPYHGNNANGYNITADASCSHDDIAIVMYTWSFGDGTPVVTNGAIPTEGHTYPAIAGPREYTGTVCVDDGMSPIAPGEICAQFTVTTSAN